MPITQDTILAGYKPVNYYVKSVTATAATAARGHSLWNTSGFPLGAGAFNATLNGAVLSSSGGLVAGQIPIATVTAPEKRYIANGSFLLNGTGGLFTIADRIWHNGGISMTITTPQTIVTPTFARDANNGTNGVGIYLALEIQTTTGAGTPTITVSYTNSDGVAGRTAVNQVATAATSNAGSFYLLTLQAGDVGVRSVQSVTLSATWTSGAAGLVAYRPILSIPIASTGVPTAFDPLTGGLPEVFDNSVPFIFGITTGSATLSGSLSLQYTHVNPA